MELEEAIRGRRSVRRFDGRRVASEVVRELAEAAALAPAPHHTHPWRLIVLSADARHRLVEAMQDAWRRDLEGDDTPPEEVARRLERSRRRLLDAPLLLLTCLDMSQAHPWPDERRRRAERDMFVQSLGAALQNLQLLAHARGLGSCLLGAPLFCQEAVREALLLPPSWEPMFLVEVGYPDPCYRPRVRPSPALETILREI